MDYFYKRIDIQSCKDIGAISDTQCVEWWNNQDTAISHEAIHRKKRIPIKKALRKLTQWIKKYDNDPCIWTNGTSFDIPILKNAYQMSNLDIPWKFWNERDVRTVLYLGNTSINNTSNVKKHHALYDCWRQIIALQKAIQNMNLTVV